MSHPQPNGDNRFNEELGGEFFHADGWQPCRTGDYFWHWERADAEDQRSRNGYHLDQESLKKLPDATSTYEIQAFHESDLYYQHAGQLVEERYGWYLYTTYFDNRCVKLKASTGELMWRFSSLEQNEPFPIVVDIDGDGKLECIFNSIDEHVYCLDAETGTLKWENHAGFGIDCFGSSADTDNDGVSEYIIKAGAEERFI